MTFERARAEIHHPARPGKVEELPRLVQHERELGAVGAQQKFGHVAADGQVDRHARLVQIHLLQSRDAVHVHSIDDDGHAGCNFECADLLARLQRSVHSQCTSAVGHIDLECTWSVPVGFEDGHVVEPDSHIDGSVSGSARGIAQPIGERRNADECRGRHVADRSIDIHRRSTRGRGVRNADGKRIALYVRVVGQHLDKNLTPLRRTRRVHHCLRRVVHGAHRHRDGLHGRCAAGIGRSNLELISAEEVRCRRVAHPARCGRAEHQRAVRRLRRRHYGHRLAIDLGCDLVVERGVFVQRNAGQNDRCIIERRNFDRDRRCIRARPAICGSERKLVSAVAIRARRIGEAQRVGARQRDLALPGRRRDLQSQPIGIGIRCSDDAGDGDIFGGGQARAGSTRCLVAVRTSAATGAHGQCERGCDDHGFQHLVCSRLSPFCSSCLRANFDSPHGAIVF